MRFLRLVAVSLLAVTAGATAGHTQGVTLVAQAKKQAAAPRNVGTHVYLLRGFMDIFSTGMDDLGVKLNRSGIRASVHGHAEYPSLADGIADRYRQGVRENVVIIGHSLGANAAFQMAEQLGKSNIPVPLIIAYDPTAPMTASSNVARVVNFYSSTNGWGTSVARGAGFRGTLANVDLSRRGEVGHTDIDKSPSLHTQSISYIRSIGGAPTTTTERPKSNGKDDESRKLDDNGAAKSSTSAAVPAPQTEQKTTGEKTETAASPVTTTPATNN
jgi:hypothetical protein